MPHAARTLALRIAIPAIALLLLLAAASPARAAGLTDSLVPQEITPASQTQPPPGFAVSAREAIRAADRVPHVVAERRAHPDLKATATIPTYGSGPPDWQVLYASGSKHLVEVHVGAQVPRVTQVWTGWQVDWLMARGVPGEFGGSANAWYLWLPLALLFLAPFVDRRRPWRMLHLDLVMLLGFGVSLAFFNAGRIDLSVPLAYPFLGYLLVRLLVAGFRPSARGGSGPLIPHLSSRWLVVGLVVLCAFRVGMNIADSQVIDVGYAGVVGADRITHKEELYVDNDVHGDTYGPVNYLAYVPFEQAFPWSGSWDDLPAAHAAAIFFDLLTLLGLFLLGIRLRAGPAGRRLGLGLAWAWAAYPFTFTVLMCNANDALIGALLAFTLLALASPGARGALLALGTAAKFVPGVLAPLFAGGTGERRQRSALLFAASFTGVCVAAVALYLPAGGVREFWDTTIGFQLHRESPFSIWGQYDLGALHTLAKVAATGLALAFFAVPRHRDAFQVAALGAALLVAFDIVTTHWFYLYLAWMAPFAFVALFAAYRTAETDEELAATFRVHRTSAPDADMEVVVVVGDHLHDPVRAS